MTLCPESFFVFTIQSIYPQWKLKEQFVESYFNLY